MSKIELHESHFRHYMKVIQIKSKSLNNDMVKAT